MSEAVDLSEGEFRSVIDDDVEPGKVGRVLFCSGKIYYELLQRREERRADDIAIIRLEQFHPFPKDGLSLLLDKYDAAAEWTWVQEEPQNMGAWWYVKQHWEESFDQKLAYIGRGPSASPATGFSKVYKREQAALSHEAVGPQPEE